MQGIEVSTNTGTSIRVFHVPRSIAPIRSIDTARQIAENDHHACKAVRYGRAANGANIHAANGGFHQGPKLFPNESPAAWPVLYSNALVAGKSYNRS